MNSQQFEDYGQPLVSRHYDTPQPQGDEVLIRVKACGVCHSDVHIWEGHFDLGGGQTIELRGGQSLPFTLGHEIAGEVAAFGDSATGVSVGQSCVVYPWIGCGDCQLCHSGREHLCARPRALGATVNGGYSDYVLVPHARYLFDHGEVPAAVACTYACSGVTAYSALNKVREQVQRRQLLLVGAGGVGLAALEIARVTLDCEIIVADIDAGKRAAALRQGADEVLDPTDRDAVKALLKRTGGVAAVVDFVGAESTVKVSMGLLAKGGTLLVVGLFGGAYTLSLPLLPLKSISLVGSYVGSLQDMTELMALARSGRLKPLPVEQQPLHCACQALQNLREGKVLGRIVLTPEN